MDHVPHAGTPHRPENLPLTPQPSASLECLLGRLHRIHALLLHRGFSDAVASRAVNEVLRIGQRALETGKAAGMSGAQRAGWLWRVAVNAARRAAAKELVFVSLEYEPPDIYPPCPDDDAFWQALREAVNGLPPQQKQAFELCGLQGVSLREAARAMGVCPSTVEYHFESSCAQLAQALSGLENWLDSR